MRFGPLNSGVAAGGAGVATANADSNIVLSGRVVAIYVRYNDSPPATTDVVIKTKGTTVPSLTLLTLTDKNTDGWFWPRVLNQTNLGVDVAGNYDWPMIDDFINVAIAQANNSDSVDVWFLME